MAEQVNVLSVDGGGIRGVVAAVVLAEIEARTGRSVASLFDLVAGTSTGALLALGLAKPGADGRPEYPARRLVELYEEEGRNIFRRPLRHRIAALGNLADQKYPSAGLEAVLRRYFGDARLSSALTDVFVPSYEIERRQPFFFRSYRARARADYDYPMRAVAQAASAAPTYFEPVRLRALGGDDRYALVDGGVYANNPALCAFVEAKDLHPGASRCLVASLGTGEATRPLPYDEVRRWGLVRWAQPLLDVVFDGVSDTVGYQLARLTASDEARRCYRFQVPLPPGREAIDDASPANVAALRRLGEALVRERSDDLDALCRQLVAR